MCFVCVVQPITLQALPGLPPGAQGHLLVKTESGQYQLLKVGMSPAPTATSGTPVVPSTVATTTSMSIAQQLPNPLSSSTSILSVNNSNHVSTSNLVSSSVSSAQPSVVVSTSSSNRQVVGTVVVSTTSGSSSNNAMTVPTPSGVTTAVVTAPNPSSTPTVTSNTASPANIRLQSIPSNAANSTTVSIGFFFLICRRFRLDFH